MMMDTDSTSGSGSSNMNVNSAAKVTENNSSHPFAVADSGDALEIRLQSAAANGQQLFLFREEEFEAETFEAAAFINKYRRIGSIPLESLKEQLMEYSGALKQQLYQIINRDYQDFITISTKLDGVDTRLELLRKPLSELRLDLTTLHDGIVGSMQTIEEKLTYRQEISGRKQLLLLFHQSMQLLERSRHILLAVGGHGSSSSVSTADVQQQHSPINSRPQSGAILDRRIKFMNVISRKYSHLDACSSIKDDQSSDLKSFEAESSVQNNQQQQQNQQRERSLFVCSELERVAHCLAQIGGNLSCIRRLIDSSTSAGNTVDNSGVGISPQLQVSANFSSTLTGIPAITALSAASSTAVATTAADESAGKAKIPFSGLSSKGAVIHLYRTLEAQCKSANELLLSKLHVHLTQLFTSSTVSTMATEGGATTTAATASTPECDEIKKTKVASERSFAHCLRALVVLNSGQLAEERLREIIVDPLVKTYLTQGRVDGRGGRGSYSGLQQALQGLVHAFKQSDALCAFLRIAEEQRAAADDSICWQDAQQKAPSVDLLVHGFWLPVTDVLKDRFPDMFSIGIPNTFSNCYRAVEMFLNQLPDLLFNDDAASSAAVASSAATSSSRDTSSPLRLGSTAAAIAAGGSRSRRGVSLRLQEHEAVLSFQAQWKLDLYFQLRCRELQGRIDRACESTTKDGLLLSSSPSRINGGNTSKLLESLYSRSGSAVTAGQLTLAPEVCQKLRSEISNQVRSLSCDAEGFQIPLFVAVAVELRSCLHSSVLLAPLLGRLFSLALRIIRRLEAHVALTCNTSTPSFSKSDVEQLRQVYESSEHSKLEEQHTAVTQSAVKPLNSTSNSAHKTPMSAGATSLIESVNSNSNSLLTPSSEIRGSKGGLMSIKFVSTTEELLLVSKDLFAMERWLRGPFLSTACGVILAMVGSSPLSQTPVATPGLRINSSSTSFATSIESGIASQADRLFGTRRSLWLKITSFLAAECKRGLGAVRAVAGKYRMTNKPAPDAPSSYVATILAPLRSFQEQNADALNELIAVECQGTEKLDAQQALTRWRLVLLEDVSSSYLEQVRTLLETVKQMDTALQRRSKLRDTGSSSGASSLALATAASSTIAGAPLSDSQKISSQIILDVVAYGDELLRVGVLDPRKEIPSFSLLYQETHDSIIAL